jgi:hypothetical protein
MMTSALHRTETERWRGELSSSRPAYSDEPALGRLGMLGLGVAWHDSSMMPGASLGLGWL